MRQPDPARPVSLQHSALISAPRHVRLAPSVLLILNQACLLAIYATKDQREVSSREEGTVALVARADLLIQRAGISVLNVTEEASKT